MKKLSQLVKIFENLNENSGIKKEIFNISSLQSKNIVGGTETVGNNGCLNSACVNNGCNATPENGNSSCLNFNCTGDNNSNCHNSNSSC